MAHNTLWNRRGKILITISDFYHDSVHMEIQILLPNALPVPMFGLFQQKSFKSFQNELKINF